MPVRGVARPLPADVDIVRQRQSVSKGYGDRRRVRWIQEAAAIVMVFGRKQAAAFDAAWVRMMEILRQVRNSVTIEVGGRAGAASVGEFARRKPSDTPRCKG